MSGYCPDCGNTLCICPMVEADMVNHPPHYTQGKFETIEVIEDTNWGYRLATAFKYLHRCEYKGKKKEDLQKAIWFILREIKSIPDDAPMITGTMAEVMCMLDEDDIERNGVDVHQDAPSNVGKDLGYNAWTCKRCKKGTNLVDKDWVCADCKAIEPEPTPNIPHFDSKPPVWGSKGLEAAVKVIHHNLPKDRLGAVTEAQNYRDLMSEKHYPDNQVHKEQMTLWDIVGYD